MLVMTAPRGTRGVRELTFAPSGLFAPGGMLGVLHWPELGHGAVAVPLGKNGRLVQRVVPSPDGARVFAADIEVRAVPVGGAAAGEVVWHSTGWDTLRLGLSPCGTALVLAEKWPDAEGYRVTRVSASPPFAVGWELSTPRQLFCDPLFHPSGDAFTTVEWRRHEGTRVVTRAATDGRELSAVPVSWAVPKAVALSPDGATFVAAENRNLHVNCVADPDARLRVVPNDDPQHVTAVAFHPSGKYLGAASNDGTVKLYDARTWKVSRSFAWGIGKPTALAFSADSTLAAACTERGKVAVWDVDG